LIDKDKLVTHPAPLHCLCKWLTGVYASLVTLWFLAWLFWPDQWWPMVMANKFALYLLAPTVIIWPLALMLRRWRWIGIASLPVLFFLFFFWPFFYPNLTLSTQQPSLRVMTYNILNQNHDVDAIVSNIERYSADVVMIQELIDEVKPVLVKRLSAQYPEYKVAQPIYGGTVALFSKTPLSRVREIDFGIDRPAIVAHTLIDDQQVVVVSGHLNPSFYAYNNRPWREVPGAIEQYIIDQNSQAEQLIEHLRPEQDLAIVFACDCNSQETASTNPILAEFFTDAAKAMGWVWKRAPLPGTSHERKLGHIDYIWHRGLQPLGMYRVEDAGGSDHQPLVADFALSPAKE